MLKQPTPRKGTETKFCTCFHSSCRRNNLHPARGRKPHRPVTVLVPCVRNNLHPARGRKLMVIDQTWNAIHRNNLHPARGRKQHMITDKAIVIWETTYTPQGDGKSSREASIISTETTYTPQGDGNIPAAINDRILLRNNLHPARGRKRFCFDFFFFKFHGNNLHPARGRKLAAEVLRNHHTRTNHPARGRKRPWKCRP